MCWSGLFIFVRMVLMKFTKTRRLCRAIFDIVCGFVRRIRNPIDAKQKLKMFIQPSHVRKVLVYDTEKGETTKCFIEALKRQLGAFELHDFHEANDKEKDTLSIIAVVRNTSMRTPEILREVKEKFDKENVKDLERVFVTCIYGEGYFDMIEEISETEEFNFATILPIDFIDKCLVWKLAAYLRIYWKIFLKRTNAESLRKLERCILSRKVTEKLCFNVYGAVDLLQVKEFIAVLSQNVHSSIHLQDVKPIEELINVTAPTLICTTGDVKDCQEKLKKKELKNVFLVHITDVGKRSEIRVMHDIPDDMENKLVIHEEQNPSSTLPVGAGNNTAQNDENMPCQVYEVLYYDGKFKVDSDLIKQFEDFFSTLMKKLL